MYVPKSSSDSTLLPCGPSSGIYICPASIRPAIPFQYCIFECFRRTQPHNDLGLDFDGLAGLRITAHARLAVRLHHAADAGDHELARPALGFLHGELEKLIKEESGSFLGCANLLGDMSHDFRFAQWLGGHRSLLMNCVLAGA